MSNACDSVRIKYKGNGTQKQFTFPFTYMHWYDVTVGLWDENKKEYIDQKNKFVFANATTIEFLQAPPAPTDSSLYNVLIGRNTDLTKMNATFFPGSSIRAEDLNDDFDQLRLAIQENRCQVEATLDQLQVDFWSKKSVRSRADYQKGESPYDTMYRLDQEQQLWRKDGDQEAIPTTGAVAARLDPYLQDGLPAKPSTEQPGKTWINTDDCWESYWNPDANAWVAYVNTGPRGAVGPEGPQGADGPMGPALNVLGHLAGGDWTAIAPVGPTKGDVYVLDGDVTNFPGGGTPGAGEAVTYNGTTWVNIGAVIGQKGDKGDPGPKGDKGDTGTPGPSSPEWNRVGTTLTPTNAGDTVEVGSPTADTHAATRLYVDEGDVWARTGPVVYTKTPNDQVALDARLYQTERTITGGAFDLATGNLWTCGAITVPNPTNGTDCQTGAIRITAGPVAWGSNFKFPGGTAPTIAAFPAVIPFYVVDANTILMGKVVEDIR